MHADIHNQYDKAEPLRGLIKNGEFGFSRNCHLFADYGRNLFTPQTRTVEKYSNLILLFFHYFYVVFMHINEKRENMYVHNNVHFTRIPVVISPDVDGQHW